MSLSLLRRRAPSTDAPRDDLVAIAALATGAKRSEIAEVTSTVPGLLIVASGERLILVPADRPDGAGRTGLLAVDKAMPVGPPRWQPRRGDDLAAAPSTAARWSLDNALSAASGGDEVPAGRSARTARLQAVASAAVKRLEALRAEADELPASIRRLTASGDVTAVVAARQRLAEMPDVLAATEANVTKLQREAGAAANVDREIRVRSWELRAARLLVSHADQLDAAVAAFDAIAAEAAFRDSHVGGGDGINVAQIVDTWRTNGRTHVVARCAELSAEIAALRYRAGAIEQDAVTS